MKNLIELSVRIHASAGWIWSALTDSGELENWWSDGVLLEPKVGGKFCESWKDDQGKAQLATGKVLELKKDHYITFTWKEKNWPANAQTKCTLAIEDKGTHRFLTLKHEGWESLPEADRAAILKDFKVGWNYHLKELQSYLDD